MEFETNDALARFMEDEGLSPITLLEVTPKPTATALLAEVVKEWVDLDLVHAIEPASIDVTARGRPRLFAHLDPIAAAAAAVVAEFVA